MPRQKTTRQLPAEHRARLDEARESRARCRERLRKKKRIRKIAAASRKRNRR